VADCCCEESKVDPQLARLTADLKALQRSLQRIGSLSAGEPAVREPKEKRTVSQADRQAAEKEAAGEKPARPRTRKA